MNRTDVIVIGSGLAGLTAALASAMRGRKVTLLSYGSGALSLSSGLIDFLGYDESHRAVRSPRKAMAKLPATHPYRKIGLDYLEKATDFFKDFTKKQGLPYHGSLDAQMLVPTAVGTLKPTGLAPQSLSGSEALAGKKKVVAVGIKGLKDFYAGIMMENLKKSLGEGSGYETTTVETGLTGGRDLTALDVAHWLDTQEGRAAFASQLGKYRGAKDTVLILPQILGSKGEAVYLALKGELGTELLETTGLPPSVNGLRLQAMYKKALRDLGVTMVENTKVIGAETKGKRCVWLVAEAGIREKIYRADKYILATGGFYSGGITMRDFEKPREEVFHLPVYFVAGEENWSNKEFFSHKAQGYARTGILTDESLRPVDKHGKVVLENVYVVGRNLGGYDLCFEHSGNGVALGSGYKAAQM